MLLHHNYFLHKWRSK